MKLLADENIHGAIVQWLRDHGHDVLWAAEDLQRQPDPELLRLAQEQSRILLTADLDFGELVVRRRMLTSGVILLRLEGRTITERIAILESRWSLIDERASGHFVVIGRGKTRIRPLPSGDT